MRCQPWLIFSRDARFSLSNFELYIGLSISDLMLYTVTSDPVTSTMGVLVARPKRRSVSPALSLLLAITELGNTSLGVQVVVPVAGRQHRKISSAAWRVLRLLVQHSPLNSPVHDVVRGDEWRHDVEDLCAGSSPRVEDGCVGCAGEGVLSVGGEAVGDDALLGLSRGACETDDVVSMPAVLSVVPKCDS